MKIGISFPTLELHDPEEMKGFAQGAEQLGFHHMTAIEHTLGVRTSASYTPDVHIHEPLVLFAFLAAVTRTIQFANSILILPQRQTVLVARQAAEIDALSGGRLRLGIGLGSNEEEAIGLGTDFHTRGARVEEQIEVMRMLWTQDVVNFDGRWHHIIDGGLTVLPVQRPIPIWIGGGHGRRPLERIGRLADGWVAGSSAQGDAEAQLDTIRSASVAAGRPRDAVQVQGRMPLVGGRTDEWASAAERWLELGATHLAVNTSRGGFTTAAEHLALAERFMNEVGVDLAS